MVVLTLPGGATLAAPSPESLIERWCELVALAQPDVLLSPRDLKRDVARSVQRAAELDQASRLPLAAPSLPPERPLPWEDTDDAFLTAGAERGCWQYPLPPSEPLLPPAAP